MPVTKIIIHCAATPNGRPDTIDDIERMHKARGFRRSARNVAKYNSDIKHVGYHWVIGVNGELWAGRAMDEVGAHVYGHNRGTNGICMVGTDKFTPKAWDTLKKLLAVYEFLSPKAPLDIKGHRDYSKDLNNDGKITRGEWTKICPGFSVAEYEAAGRVPPSDAVLK